MIIYFVIRNNLPSLHLEIYSYHKVFQDWFKINGIENPPIITDPNIGSENPKFDRSQENQAEWPC